MFTPIKIPEAKAYKPGQLSAVIDLGAFDGTNVIEIPIKAGASPIDYITGVITLPKESVLHIAFGDNDVTTTDNLKAGLGSKEFKNLEALNIDFLDFLLPDSLYLLLYCNKAGGSVRYQSTVKVEV